MIVLLDELHKLIWKYEMEAGTLPNEITITKSVMRDFMREVTELRDGFEHTFDTQDGIIGKYQGIPVKVAYGDDNDKRIIVTGERNYFEPVYMARPVTYAPKDDHYQYYRTFDFLPENGKYAIMARIDTAPVGQKEDDQDIGITDEQLVDLLNGGGFNAVS